jgi:hypothetical protein
MDSQLVRIGVSSFRIYVRPDPSRWASPFGLRAIAHHDLGDSVMNAFDVVCHVRHMKFEANDDSVRVKIRSFDVTTRPTTDSHRLPLCRLCEKLISKIKMPDRRRIGFG